jgi:hypothetical protein
MKLTKDQKTGLLLAMSGADDDNHSDAMWQAMLEDCAIRFGERLGIEIDGYDAFMMYIMRND